MSITPPRLFLLLLASLLAACSKVESPPAQPENKETAAASTPAGPASPSLDACSLLSSDQIASVIGEPVTDSQRTEESAGGLVISVCHFALPTPRNSVTLRLVQRAPGSEGKDPRQVWKETYAPEKMPPEAQPGGRPPVLPERIENVGEEAYWRSARRGCALYVLKGNAYISVGVIECRDREAALQRCTQLAEMAIQKL